MDSKCTEFASNECRGRDEKSGWFNDAPNSLTKLENNAVQVEKKGEIANVTNRSFQNVTSL